MKELDRILNGEKGNFRKKLAEAYLISDRENREKLNKAFPDLKKIYKDWYNN